MIDRMTSLAKTPGESLPWSTTLNVSGTRSQISSVAQIEAVSDLPMPAAKAPSAP
jgi:hypothetical protein